MFRSVVGLDVTVTIGPVPETNGDKALNDAEDSEYALSWIKMGEEAGGLRVVLWQAC